MVGSPHIPGDASEVGERARLAKQLQESKALYEISQMLASAIDLDLILQQIADAANSLIKSRSTTILHLLNKQEDYLQAVAVSGSEAPSTEHRMNFKSGEGVAGLAIFSGQTINVIDVLDDPRYVPASGISKVENRSLLVAPIKTGDKSLGTLSVQSKLPGAFSEDDVRLLTILGNQAAIAIERARLYFDLQTSLQHEKAARAQLVQSEKLAALGRIVASVAHELNNPIQAIQNALYLINLEEALSPQAREDLQTVLNEVNRMTDLVARLREIYRPTTGEEFESGSINELVVEVQKLLSTHLRHNQIEFKQRLSDDILDVPMIRDQIKQVLLNICLNAVEAMPEGGKLVVTTSNHNEPEGILFRVADDGPSISPKILPYIFDPFVTTKDGGTGLGLAISYDIIQRHHGGIEVDSKPGKGTEFKVWLPIEHQRSPHQNQRERFDSLWIESVRGAE